jgi:ureidoglycolate hydrolase
MAERKKQHATKKPQSERIGGREFGNVIEPMQAQMASGNQGLAAETAKPKKKMTRKKAA